MASPRTLPSLITDDQLNSIRHKISIPPRVLRPSAGKRACCIFRVPRSLVKINGDLYHPCVVSLGPYHLGRPHLAMIQEHKYRYLGAIVARPRPSLLSLESLVRLLEPMIGQAVECYSESISLSTIDFLEMLVLDSAFLIELFMRFEGSVPHDRDDPIFTMSWVLPFFQRDFLCLENQIPYFILEKIYEEVTAVTPCPVPPLASLALSFFAAAMDLQQEATASYDSHRHLHLLDLFRAAFLPRNLSLTEPGRGSRVKIHSIPCVSKLRLAGIHFRKAEKQEEKLLEVRFDNRKGLMKLPTISFYDLMGPFLMNCVAYEQCHSEIQMHFTAYTVLLDCLVNTARDVEYLSDHGIIENYLGTDEEVAGLINKMGNGVALDFDDHSFSELFNDVHNYYKNRRHVQWAGFKYTYFNTPWSFISALAAFVLLVLSVTQTFFTVYAFFFPPKP